jgi:uncharacterized membrane protein YkvA (DUF1232 family)
MRTEPSWRARLARWARELRVELLALSRAAKDPRTPWYAWLIAVLVVAYATSPIDLIPDFIPLFGMVDDLILIPLGIALVLRLIPAHVVAEHREVAAADAKLSEDSRAGLAIVVGLWLVGLLSFAALMHRWFH